MSARRLLELVIRFGYGEVIPWVTRQTMGIRAIAGPDTSRLYSEVQRRS